MKEKASKPNTIGNDNKFNLFEDPPSTSTYSTSWSLTNELVLFNLKNRINYDWFLSHEMTSCNCKTTKKNHLHHSRTAGWQFQFFEFERLREKWIELPWKMWNFALNMTLKSSKTEANLSCGSYNICQVTWQWLCMREWIRHCCTRFANKTRKSQSAKKVRAVCVVRALWGAFLFGDNI